MSSYKTIKNFRNMSKPTNHKNFLKKYFAFQGLGNRSLYESNAENVATYNNARRVLNNYGGWGGWYLASQMVGGPQGFKLNNSKYKKLLRVSNENLLYAGKVRRSNPGVTNLNRARQNLKRANAINKLKKQNFLGKFRNYKKRKANAFKLAVAPRTFNAGQRGQMHLPRHIMNKILKM